MEEDGAPLASQPRLHTQRETRMTSRPIVSYLRVSTARQGRSGLGMEAQRAAIARFAEAEGYEIVRELVDAELRIPAIHRTAGETV
jgi:hypothetical protein